MSDIVKYPILKSNNTLLPWKGIVVRRGGLSKLQDERTFLHRVRTKRSRRPLASCVKVFIETWPICFPIDPYIVSSLKLKGSLAINSSISVTYKYNPNAHHTKNIMRIPIFDIANTAQSTPNVLCKYLYFRLSIQHHVYAWLVREDKIHCKNIRQQSECWNL